MKLLDENKRSVKNCGCEKNETVKNCWKADHNFRCNQKKVVASENRLIPKQIKETIHSSKNPEYISKIPICSLKYDFLIYGSSKLLTNSIPADSKETYAKPNFYIRKTLQSNQLNQPHCATSCHPGPQVLLSRSRFVYLL